MMNSVLVLFFFFKQKTAYEMRISDWSSDVCSSDLVAAQHFAETADERRVPMLVAGQAIADEHAERRRPLGGEIGKIHRGELPPDLLRPFGGKEMDALAAHVVEIGRAPV